MNELSSSRLGPPKVAPSSPEDSALEGGRWGAAASTLTQRRSRVSGRRVLSRLLGLGVGVLGLVSFLLATYVKPRSDFGAAASPSSPPEVPAARAGSASERLVDRSSLSSTVSSEKHSNDQRGAESENPEVAEVPYERAGSASVGPSAREEVLKVLERAEAQFRDPEIRRAFSRERKKIMANFSE